MKDYSIIIFLFLTHLTCTPWGNRPREVKLLVQNHRATKYKRQSCLCQTCFLESHPLEAHPYVLKIYFCLCTLESLLWGFRRPYLVSGIEPGSTACKQAFYSLYYLPDTSFLKSHVREISGSVYLRFIYSSSILINSIQC